jgi:hypothetical protein
MISEIVILGEKEDAANRASRCLLDLIEYRAARRLKRKPCPIIAQLLTIV